MGRTVTETKLADDIVISLIRYRDETDGLLKWRLTVHAATTDGTDILFSYTRDDILPLLTTAQQTAVLGAATNITAKLAEGLGVTTE